MRPEMWCQADFTGLMFFQARLSPVSGLPPVLKLMATSPFLDTNSSKNPKADFQGPLHCLASEKLRRPKVLRTVK